MPYSFIVGIVGFTGGFFWASVSTNLLVCWYAGGYESVNQRTCHLQQCKLENTWLRNRKTYRVITYCTFACAYCMYAFCKNLLKISFI